MRVSVIIPCHNSLTYLPETLRSVYDQDLSSGVIADYEVFLVDDGGTDDLAGWLSRQGYPENGTKRVNVIRQPNAGVSAARNFGIRQSTGNLVAFCDSDDLWTPRSACLLAQRFVEDPAIGMAYGWYDVIDAEGQSTGRVFRGAAQGQVWEDFVLDNPVSASGVMVQRRALESSGGFSENRERFPIDVEDWELWIRIASTWPVGLVPEVITHHRRHDSNSSTDIESLELAYENLMKVVFENVEAHQELLRPRAQARYKMILAWQSLNDRQDVERARAYLKDAAADSPRIRRTPGYWRLRFSAEVMGLAGERGYAVIRRLNQSARRGQAPKDPEPQN